MVIEFAGGINGPAPADNVRHAHTQQFVVILYVCRKAGSIVGIVKMDGFQYIV